MTQAPYTRLVRPSRATNIAVAASVVMIVFSAAFLLARYRSLPSLLPVHFKPNGYPNGWQYKTYWRVLLPVFVQLVLASTLGTVGVLLLSRSHGVHDEDAPDVKAASTAAEAVALLTLIWVAFQAYAAVTLASMWQRERAGLGAWYIYLEVAGLLLTIGVSIRAHRNLGRPEPRAFVPEHWRYGQLYKNPDDPALFVPTRNGARWTLNFGRPVAAALMGVILTVGVIAPAVILGLLLR
jgi:uncharacterized membrane protein